jgi:peptidyl-prolyl cis-trans isomerase SurA
MVMILRLLNIAFCAFVLLQPLAATPKNKVVITVGTQCITQQDVDNRLNFLALMSGIGVTQENRPSLTQEAAKMLVQEHLELQEMTSSGLTIQDEAVNNQLAEMAGRIGVLPEKLDSFFREKNIPMDTVRQFLTIQYYWPQYIKFKYPTVANVSEERIELMYKEQLAQKTKPRYLLAEIFIPVNAPSEEGSVQKQMNMIHSELLKGGQFPMLAQQFSQSSSAKQGGNMGWINLELLSEKARSIVRTMTVGQLTTPHRLDDGYVIYALIDKRLPGESSIKDTVFSVRQIIMNLDNLQEDAITSELKKCKSCSALEAVLAKHPYIQVEKSDHVVIQQMPPQFAELLGTLKDNTLSDAIRYPQGSMFLWVCGRKVMDGVIPKDELRYRVMMQNLTQKSRSILNRLSRTILIESKDPNYTVN